MMVLAVGVEQGCWIWKRARQNAPECPRARRRAELAIVASDMATWLACCRRNLYDVWCGGGITEAS